MDFEIKGKSLERAVFLAQRLGCREEVLFPEIFRKGLDAVESGNNIARSKGGKPSDMPALDLSVVPADLSKSQKSFIRKNLVSMDDALIAKRIGSAPLIVRACRYQLASEYIPGHYLKETDVTIGEKFGIDSNRIMLLRKRLNILRERGKGLNTACSNRKVFAEQLGTRKEIIFALTKGGKTLYELFRDKGLNVRRQRACQIIERRFSLSVRGLEKEPIWYIRRMLKGKPDKLARALAVKEKMEKAVNEAGGVKQYAQKIGVIESTLRYMCSHIGASFQKGRKNAKMAASSD